MSELPPESFPQVSPSNGSEPPAPSARPERRLWLHGLLLAMTLASLTLAGAMFWPRAGITAPLRVSGGVDLAWQLFRIGAPYAFWVTLILGAHEMGHYLACRYYGIPATLPFFIPGIPPLGSFGAVIRIRGPIPDRRALFDVAAAGPIAGFAIALPVLLLGVRGAEVVPEVADGAGFVFGEPLALLGFRYLLDVHDAIQTNALIGAGWVGMLVTSLNLFPVGQLDGGHAVYALSRRAHRLTARLTLVGLAALIVGQAVWLRQMPAYAVWFLILLWMRDRHPRLIDESGGLGVGRRLVSLLLALILLLSFIPLPVRVIDGG